MVKQYEDEHFTIPISNVPLKDWDNIFAAADTTTDAGFRDWDITLDD